MFFIGKFVSEKRLNVSAEYKLCQKRLVAEEGDR